PWPLAAPPVARAGLGQEVVDQLALGAGVEVALDDPAGREHGQVGNLAPQLGEGLLALAGRVLLGPLEDRLVLGLSLLLALGLDAVGDLRGLGDDVLALASRLVELRLHLLRRARRLVPQRLRPLHALADARLALVQHLEDGRE